MIDTPRTFKEEFRLLPGVRLGKVDVIYQTRWRWALRIETRGKGVELVQPWICTWTNRHGEAMLAIQLPSVRFLKK